MTSGRGLARVIACAIAMLPAPAGWAAEAATAGALTPENPHIKSAMAFVEEMSKKAPNLLLDFRLESIPDLEAWLRSEHDAGRAPLTMKHQRGLGNYLGETYRRAYNGRWVGDQVQFTDQGTLQRIKPLERARARLSQGPGQSLNCYTQGIQPKKR